MPYQLRITCIHFLFAVLIAAFIGAGGAIAQSSPKYDYATTMEKARTGDANAQFILGMMYDGGNSGAPNDAVKAVEWMLKAAAQGHATAQGYVGSLYSMGQGISQDVVLGYAWLSLSISSGEDTAHKLRNSMEGTLSATEKAEALRLSSNWKKGQILVRERAPIDAKPTPEQRFSVLIQKAEAGDAAAQKAVGSSYANGAGVPKDSVKAVEWFKKGAAQGHAPSQGLLGAMYFLGNGLPKDVVLSYAWTNLAVSAGEDEQLKKMRNSYEARLSVTEKSEGQRLSSNWRKGQILVREGQPADLSAVTPTSSGVLSKQRNGTMFVVSKFGHAITNQHVVAGCTELRIQGRDAVAKLVTEDKVNDLALLQLHGTAKDAASVSSEPSKLRQGEDIIVFGFPLNSMLSSGGNLTPGVVSALTGLGNNTNQIQITAPIQPGSSGSPVMNRKGEVVGVVSMKLSDSKMAQATGQVAQSVNFAVNGQTLKSFLDVNKVKYRTIGSASREKSTADLADEARKWTLVVECWK